MGGRRVPGRRPARGGGEGLLTVAACLLLLLAAAQGYVSFRAQYVFIDHAKQARLPSMLEALGLDTGAVIFALLALSLARRGRPAAVERILNVACALGSLTMNLLAADLGSPRSVTVWVLPSALYALASDRLIAVVRRWAQAAGPGTHLGGDGSPWGAFGGLALWALRLIFDTPGTVAGFRRWVLAEAPIAPGIRAGLPAGGGQPALPAGTGGQADGRQDHQAERWPQWHAAGHEPHRRAEPPVPAATGPHGRDPGGNSRSERAPGESKRQALIRLYERCGQAGDPRYGNPAKTAELAAEIAALIGYHAGTARRELAKHAAPRAAAATAAPAPAAAVPPSNSRGAGEPAPSSGPQQDERTRRAAVTGDQRQPGASGEVRA